MKVYPVTVDWMSGLPSTPYRWGIGAWEGIVMHQTANCNDTAKLERNWESGHFMEAFVHEFIDPYEIIQVANPNYIAYGAGPKANSRFIHLELCSAHSQEEFDDSFDMWCQRASYFLKLKGLGVSRAQANGSGTLWAHAEVSDLLGGSDHQDPIDYLRQWGKTWDDVHIRVQQHYDSTGEEEEQMQLELWEWRMLGDAINGLSKVPQEATNEPLLSYDWAEKAYKQELKTSEALFILTVALARAKGISVEKRNA